MTLMYVSKLMVVPRWRHVEGTRFMQVYVLCKAAEAIWSPLGWRIAHTQPSLLRLSDLAANDHQLVVQLVPRLVVAQSAKWMKSLNSLNEHE